MESSACVLRFNMKLFCNFCKQRSYMMIELDKNNSKSGLNFCENLTID